MVDVVRRLGSGQIVRLVRLVVRKVPSSVVARRLARLGRRGDGGSRRRGRPDEEAVPAHLHGRVLLRHLVIGRRVGELALVVARESLVFAELGPPVLKPHLFSSDM